MKNFSNTQAELKKELLIKNKWLHVSDLGSKKWNCFLLEHDNIVKN